MEWKCCRKTPCLLFSVCLYWSYGWWTETWQWWMIIWKLGACKNISHTPVNVSMLCSAGRASTHFSNLSPKSNKLPKYVHFASFPWRGQRRKELIVNICFPFVPPHPLLWSMSAPPGVTAAAAVPCHPALRASTHPSSIHPAEAQWSQSVHMRMH